MKKLLLSLTIASAALTASAQDSQVRFGVKAGVAFPTVSISEKTETDIKMNTSFYVGGTADIPVGETFSIQPGITFLGKGFKTSDSETESGAKIEGTIKSNVWYIEVPVNVLANFPVGDGKVFIGAGPYYGYAISGKNKTEGTVTQDGQKLKVSTSEDVEFGKDGSHKRGDFGVNFLGGYQLSNGFNIHAGYGLGLSSISQESDVKVKNRVLSVGVGFTF